MQKTPNSVVGQGAKSLFHGGKFGVDFWKKVQYNVATTHTLYCKKKGFDKWIITHKNKEIKRK